MTDFECLNLVTVELPNVPGVGYRIEYQLDGTSWVFIRVVDGYLLDEVATGSKVSKTVVHRIVARDLADAIAPDAPLNVREYIFNKTKEWLAHCDYNIDLNFIKVKPIMSPEEMSRKLPGMKFETFCPEPDFLMCTHPFISRKQTLWGLIQHLNDRHKWSREQIADWLDKLHDDGAVDLSFKTPDN